MAVIDRKYFFRVVRKELFGGKLSQSQVDGTAVLLNEWEQSYQDRDLRWLAYALATALHETAHTMQPIKEFGLGRNHRYGGTYYGRGYVQLTWQANYQKMSAIFNVNLVHNPDLALEPELAAKIMFTGMLRGSFSSGNNFAKYFNETTEDWTGARRIINGTDRKHIIAGYGKIFYRALTPERKPLKSQTTKSAETSANAADQPATLPPSQSPTLGGAVSEPLNPPRPEWVPTTAPDRE